MCHPTIVEDQLNDPGTLSCLLMREIDRARNTLRQEPEFVDMPVGPGLRDCEVNADHAHDHLESAFKSAVLVAKYFVCEGGNEHARRDKGTNDSTWCYVI